MVKLNYAVLTRNKAHRQWAGTSHRNTVRFIRWLKVFVDQLTGIINATGPAKLQINGSVMSIQQLKCNTLGSELVNNTQEVTRLIIIHVPPMLHTSKTPNQSYFVRHRESNQKLTTNIFLSRPDEKLRAENPFQFSIFFSTNMYWYTKRTDVILILHTNIYYMPDNQWLLCTNVKICRFVMRV